MTHIKFDYSNASSFMSEEEMSGLAPFVSSAHEMIHKGTGTGSDFLGWVDLPENYDREEFSRIQQSADKIRSDSDVLVVIGIGGSYLGAKAAVEMLTPTFGQDGPEIVFAGHQLSSHYMNELKDHLKDKDFSINVISKSGTTTEPAIAFRVFKKLLEERYDNPAERIYVTTDKEKGALNTLGREKGYEMFVVPDDVGGRYSVLTAVGLLPIAAAGIDIGKFHGVIAPTTPSGSWYTVERERLSSTISGCSAAMISSSSWPIYPRDLASPMPSLSGLPISFVMSSPCASTRSAKISAVLRSSSMRPFRPSASHAG